MLTNLSRQFLFIFFAVLLVPALAYAQDAVEAAADASAVEAQNAPAVADPAQTQVEVPAATDSGAMDAETTAPVEAPASISETPVADSPAPAEPAPARPRGATPDIKLIDEAVIKQIRAFIETDIVRMSTENQNVKYGDMTEEQILKLDTQWRAETKSDNQPLVSATLSNPLSSYLTRVQAHSGGLFTEMFVMDKNGLNVGQSSITSDYWQGDEDKFKKTYPQGVGAVFVDEAEQDEETGLWKAQANLTIANTDGSAAIGAITVEINLTELQRRKKLGLE